MKERPPLPALAGLVSVTWVQHVPPGAAPYLHRSIPTGGAEIVCRPGSSLSIVGPSTRPRVETLEPGGTVVGVRLRPGAAGALLGVPASELLDATLDGAELWGSAAEAVTSVAAIQDLLLDRAGTEVEPLVAEAVRRLMPGRTTDLRPLWSALGVPERTFRRRCRAAIGFGPKTLHRMLRFQGFLARVQYLLAQGRSPRAAGLARLAADGGYADQAHLTRECLRLTGVPPRVFLADVTRSCGRGHDHAASFAPLLAVPVKNGGAIRP
jgi:AraC-like DNA-binding protein